MLKLLFIVVAMQFPVQCDFCSTQSLCAIQSLERGVT